MKLLYSLLIFVFTLVNTAIVFGQISQGGYPPSFERTLLNETFEVINLSPPDINKLMEEDLDYDRNGQPLRIATNVAVYANNQNSGTWEKINIGRIWRLKIVCPGALAINLQFEKFHLPEGGQFFIYNDDKTQILGSFTSLNNHESGMFSTELVEGDEVILEYFEPQGINEYADIYLSGISYAYRYVSFTFDNTDGFGDSGSCMVNINCSPEGNNWQDEKRGVARILYKEGSSWYWCTGSLVNNTLENGVPYFLTAEHCGGTASASDRNQWLFYFNYESSGCSNPGSEPGYNSLTGASLKARGPISGGSDFQLVQLNSTPPAYYGVYYNGWDRSGSSSSSGVNIHHPSGDIKKISTYTTTLTSATWNGSGSVGAYNAHWITSMSSTTNGHGVSEGGSSGSPLFNSSGRVLGTLTGGNSSCSYTSGVELFGKFSYHWQSNGSTSAYRLKPWLDPNNSGVTYLDGYDPNAANPPVADFEADNTTPGVGQTVLFTDLSLEDPTSWSWSFSPSTIIYVGGTNSSSKNPQVQFNNQGNYTVSLTATNAHGSDNETKTNYINVSFYCTASGATDYLHISQVQLGAIDNSSGQDYYYDYTYLSTDIAKDQSYDITISNGVLYESNDLGIWIDYNQDGDFYDPDENIVCDIDNYGEGTFNFTVPGTAIEGITRMRIRTKYYVSDCGDPCGTTDYGEVEDYSVNIVIGADPPVAEFEANNLNPGINETVNFTDQSTNSPVSWSWSYTPPNVTYVEGTNSSSQNPKVQFTQGGLYTVELYVTNSGGNDTETKTDYIYVIYVPVSEFEADNLNPGIGETVNFTDLSTNEPDTWSWTFTPPTVTYVGGTTSTDQDPHVQFDAGGLYTVELMVTNASGNDTETKTDYIDVIYVPVSEFEADNLNPGIGETVNFTDLSTNEPDTWSWTFTPPTVTYVGGTTSTDQDPQVQFDAEGLYTVELYISNLSGNDTEIKTDYINVSIPVVVLDITIFLEGAFNGSDMDTNLNSLIPFEHPYDVTPWNYSGTEEVESIPGTDIVDWILIEVRDAISASQALSGPFVGIQAAFLRNDGQVVDLEGNPSITFDLAIPNEMYLVVHQRNHLSVISSSALSENGGIYSYDFTSGIDQAHLDGQSLLSGGYAGMTAGNGYPDDKEINQLDIQTVWQDDAGNSGYLFGDYNLDSHIDNMDKNDIWLPNDGTGSKVPD